MINVKESAKAALEAKEATNVVLKAALEVGDEARCMRLNGSENALNHWTNIICSPSGSGAAWGDEWVFVMVCV